MVGVGGRSRACDNCRRRRVKCDLATPVCSRCHKARLQCSGPRGLAIVPYIAPNNTFGLSDASAITARKQSSTKAAQLQLIRGINVPYDDVYVAFTHSHLLLGVEAILVDPGTDRAMTNECFLALSTTYFGVKHREKAVITRGLSRYGTALQRVYRALADENISESFDVLEAVMIMVVIEFMISDQEHGWLKHARGLEWLFEKQGAKRMSSLPSLLVLEKCRASMILAAIVLRKPTVLAGAEWKTLPWSQYPGRINNLKLLTDIMADCPELFVARVQIEQGQTEQSDQRAKLLSLLRKAEGVHGDLCEWKIAWDIANRQAYTEVLPPVTTPVILDPSGATNPAWTSVLQFESLYQSNALTLYFATLILVLRLLGTVRTSLDESAEVPVMERQIHDAGLFICRSIDYHLNQTGTELVSFNLLFPLRMAYEAVGRKDRPIGIWLENILKDISAGRRGLWKSAKALLEI